MMARTHAVTGVATALGVAVALDTVVATPVAAYAVAAFAALVPDLDQPRSAASSYAFTKPVHFFSRHLRHRGPTHSIGAVALWWLAMSGLFGALRETLGEPGPWVAAATAGYASHLLADMWNKQGVELFYPFSPLGIRYWNVPLPKPLRISTRFDPQGIPWTLGRLQAKVHTERLFFRWPIYALIALLVFRDGEALLAAFRADLWSALLSLPAPVSEVLSVPLR
jgi:membrane-bound metal-dependent hydrolase YbcI (DUF457 family)